MELKRLASTMGVLGTLGLGALLAACGGSTGAVGQTQGEQSARATFIAERGSGTPGVVSDTVAFGGPGADGMMPGMIGTVEKVDGKTITVKNPMDGSTSTVQLADDARVHKQAEGSLSDLKSGDSVMAFGTKDGDTLQANLLQIGEAGGMMGRPGPGMRVAPGPGDTDGPGGDNAVPGGGPVIIEGAPGDGAIQGQPPQAAFGTVDSIDGSEITLKDDPDGTTTISVGDDTRIQKWVEVDPSEIKVGETIVATGSRDGDLFNATDVQIMPGDAMRFQRP